MGVEELELDRFGGHGIDGERGATTTTIAISTTTTRWGGDGFGKGLMGGSGMGGGFMPGMPSGSMGSGAVDPARGAFGFNITDSSSFTNLVSASNDGERMEGGSAGQVPFSAFDQAHGLGTGQGRGQDYRGHGHDGGQNYRGQDYRGGYDEGQGGRRQGYGYGFGNGQGPRQHPYSSGNGQPDNGQHGHEPYEHAGQGGQSYPSNPPPPPMHPHPIEHDIHAIDSMDIR